MDALSSLCKVLAIVAIILAGVTFIAWASTYGYAPRENSAIAFDVFWRLFIIGVCLGVLSWAFEGLKGGK